MPTPPLLGPEDRANQRISRFLKQRRGPNAVLAVLIAVALVLGLIGFGIHAVWVASVIVMGIGLGFIVANERRDRIDLSNQHHSDILDHNGGASPRPAERPADNRGTPSA